MHGSKVAPLPSCNIKHTHTLCRSAAFYKTASRFWYIRRMGEAAPKYVETLSDFVAATIRAEASRRGLTQKD